MFVFMCKCECVHVNRESAFAHFVRIDLEIRQNQKSCSFLLLPIDGFMYIHHLYDACTGHVKKKFISKPTINVLLYLLHMQHICSHSPPFMPKTDIATA